MPIPYWWWVIGGFLLGSVVWAPMGWGACKTTIHWRRTRRALHEARGTLTAIFWGGIVSLVLIVVLVRIYIPL